MARNTKFSVEGFFELKRKSKKPFKYSIQYLKILSYFQVKLEFFTDIFLTTAIFIGSASTVHKSLKIMFQNYTFWCHPGCDRCLLKVNKSFNFSDLSQLLYIFFNLNPVWDSYRNQPLLF